MGLTSNECDYLLSLPYESSGGILFPKGATAVGSELFQAPIETTIGIWQHNCRCTKFARLKFGSNKVQTRTIAETCDYSNHYTSIC